MLGQDSTALHTAAEAVSNATTMYKGSGKTVADVIKRLPADATPEQQDSAVQKNFQPKPIQWSARPDTLHLPGLPAGRSLRDIGQRNYYRESFFEGHPGFHPNLFGGRQGLAGDPIPYTIGGDDLVTCMLLGTFLLGAVMFSQSRSFVSRQWKQMFRPVRENTTVITETSAELWSQAFLVVQTSLLLGLMTFFYVQKNVTDSFIIDQSLVITLFSGVFVVYFLLREIFSWAVNWVFFDRKACERWAKNHLFLAAAEGVLLLPVVFMQSFFGLSMDAAFICGIVIVALFKVLSSYSSYTIFFRSKGIILQIFLYLCALEIVPLAMVGGVLMLLSNILKVNY